MSGGGGRGVAGFLAGAAAMALLLNPLGWPLPWTPAVDHAIHSLADRATSVPPRTVVVAQPRDPSTGAPILAPTVDGRAPAGLEEGRDFSYIDGAPAPEHRWPCGAPIGAATAGAVPAGAQAALQSAVAALAGASGLPLRALPAGDAHALITVRYQPDGTAAGPLALAGPDVLGEGGPTEEGSAIVAGAVLIRSDAPEASPGTPTGQAVLLHELGHALGLGHAAPGADETMAADLDPSRPTGLGPGDRWALHEVGCTPAGR